MKRRSQKAEFPVSDLSELLKPYQSGLVALSADQDQVVAFGETLHEVRERALDASCEKPFS